jgi:hypothetical protein
VDSFVHSLIKLGGTEMNSASSYLDPDLRDRIADIEADVNAGKRDITRAGVWSAFIFGLIIPVILLTWGFISYVG